MEFIHTTVLLDESLENLHIRPDGIYVDCTVGGAGHSIEIVRRLSAEGHLVGIDQDDLALQAAGERLAPYQDRVTLIRENFRNLKKALYYRGFEEIDGFLFDLGFSSPQVDDEERGFSYQADALLDMRMDRREKLTAQFIVNNWDEGEIARVIRDYGEEKWANRIAQFIVKERSRKPIETTGELVELIKAAIPASARRSGPHPAKRTFQALRIAVNDELNRLKEALHEAVELLRPGGRICVISFHSLEDRIVKHLFRELATECICPPGLPVCTCGVKPILKVITRKAITPDTEELDRNPRARSAALRVAEKL